MRPLRRRESILLWISGTSLAAIVASCALNAGGIVYVVEDSGAPDATSVDGAANDGALTGPDGSAPDDSGTSNGCASDQVAVDAGFCIDRTEVTNEKYAAFLEATNGDSGKDFAACSTEQLLPIASGYELVTLPSHPVRGVDWCAARAYCNWAGRRLCGAIADGGGAIATTDIGDAAVSEWQFACSANGSVTYPYGNSYDGGICNDMDLKEGGTLPVGSLAGCKGGEVGLLDMVGNVWEWENNCVDAVTPAAVCTLRGGSFNATPAQTMCGTGLAMTRDGLSGDFGIRCCSDRH